MNVNEIIDYWLASAKDDWKAATHLHEKGDYSHALFFAHLYLEKLLKAAVVKMTEEQAPPVHNLRILVGKAKLTLTAPYTELIIRVNEYNIRVRYPDFKFAFKKHCTKSFTTRELKHIREFGTWLRKRI
jgi:HEPN domain-containing protein